MTDRPLKVSHVGGPLYAIGGYFSPALMLVCSGFDWNTKTTVGIGVPGMTFNKPMRRWEGYADAVEIVVRELKERGVGVDASVLPPPVDPKSLKDIPSPYVIAAEGMKPHQLVGIRWLLRTAPEGAILADEMGVGKSAQAIRAARATKLKALIVCPNSVRGVWAGSGYLSRRSDERPKDGEIQKWWPDATAQDVSTFDFTPPAISGLFVCKGTKPDDEARAALAVAQVIVCHKDILYAWETALLAAQVRFVIFDEAHLYLPGSQDSRVGKAAAAIAETCFFRVALTGTPVPNRPKDLYGYGNVLSPGRFGDRFHRYGIRYCDGEQITVGPENNPDLQKVVWDFKGRSREEELAGRVKRFLLRRTKDDPEVALALPPFTRETIDLEVPTKFHHDSTQAVRGGKFVDALLRRQLAAAADGKLPQVVASVAGFVEEGSKVVVYTYRREVCEAIAASLRSEGIEAVYSHGGLSQKERERRIASEPTVLVATIDTVSTGISLAFADVEGFAELTFEPHKLLQAEARLHRPGQKKHVRCVYWIAAGTSDELVRDAVLKKLDAFATLVGDGGENAALKAGLAGKAATETYEESMARLYAALEKQQAAAAEVAIEEETTRPATKRAKATKRKAATR